MAINIVYICENPMFITSVQVLSSECVFLFLLFFILILMTITLERHLELRKASFLHSKKIACQNFLLRFLKNGFCVRFWGWVFGSCKIGNVRLIFNNVFHSEAILPLILTIGFRFSLCSVMSCVQIFKEVMGHHSTSFCE